MSREIKGSTKWRSGVWQVLCSQQDGSRKWFPLPGVPEGEREMARIVGATVARKVRLGEYVPGDRGETVGEYARRWCDSREKKGLASHNEDRKVIRHYVDATLGAQPIQSIKPEHLRRFVAILDGKVDEKTIRAKTAKNVWGVVRKMFTDAAKSKSDSLRVLEANPAETVTGPERAAGKTRKQYLYPSEFLALVSSPKVPVWRARLYAFSVYVWTRAGELAAQTWHDVDLAHGVIRVHESIDRARRPKSRETTKTATERLVAIEMELRPLLDALQVERSKTTPWPPVGPLFNRLPAVSGDVGLAALLRRDLRAAGVTRPDLFADTETRRQMTFHDLRATGITWAAVRGDSPLEIQERAGHSTFTMTQAYIREASVHRRPGVVFGTVFPVLPSRLLEGSDETPEAPEEGISGPENNRTSIVQSNRNGAETSLISWAQQDLNQRRLGDESAQKQAKVVEGGSPNRTTGEPSISPNDDWAETSEEPPSTRVPSGGSGRVTLEAHGVSISTQATPGEKARDVAERLALGLRQNGQYAQAVAGGLLGRRVAPSPTRRGGQ